MRKNFSCLSRYLIRRLAVSEAAKLCYRCLVAGPFIIVCGALWLLTELIYGLSIWRRPRQAAMPRKPEIVHEAE